MIINYLKLAFRNTIKYRGYSIINIVGLAGSAAITMLIIFYAISVLTFDQFHQDAESIYFMYRDRATESGRVPVYDTWAPMAEAAKDELPGVRETTRAFPAGQTWVRLGEKRFEQQVTYADSSFFTFFSFPLLAGDKNTMLNDPNSVVISREVAEKFFGDTEALGQTLNFGFQNDRVVTGVIGDIPGNSSFTFEVIFPFNDRLARQFVGENLWGASFCSSFVKLNNPKDIDQIRERANVIMEKYVTESERGNILFLPLKDYNDEFTDQRKYATTLLIVAIGILLIASINFTNLATAQSLNRTKEVGVRKVLGASKSGLINQFLSESVLLTFLALMLGGLFAEISLPFFSSLIELNIPVNFIANPELIGMMLVISIVVGVLSGSYPALYMSSFQPSDILKGGKAKGGNLYLRNALVVLQFSLAIVLLSSVAIISSQVSYMRNFDVKFDKDNVMTIPIGMRDFEDRGSAVARLISFKEQLKLLPGVVSVTASNGIPGNFPGNFSLFVPQDKPQSNPLDYRTMAIEDDYFNTYNIKLIAGRNFLPNSQNDRENSIILNQAAVKDIGWDDPIGKKLMYPRSGRTIEVIGVVEDFNYASLKDPVLPVVHYYEGDSARTHRFISVKLDPNGRTSTLGQIALTWESMDFDKAYEYFFPAERLNSLYSSEENLVRILAYATTFATFIACLGLYALASFTVMLRTKEIAVRKVLGASVTSIVKLFSRGYIIMVAISIVLAVPITWYGMTRWLESFAFRIDISLVTFIFTGGLALAVAFATVSLQSVKAAVANPVKSLRSE